MCDSQQCVDWNAHCVCDGSPSWAVERSKMKRKNDPNKPVRAPTDSADQVNARFASAQNVANGGADAPMSEAEAQQREDQESRAADEENEDLFADYEPLHYEAGQAHPDPVVETTSLSFAELPPITYQLKLHNGIFRPKSASNEFGGALSRLQLETVSYACQRHETKLPTGERAGFFLGDGVGLGKGRQLAGIVLENWLRGRRRHLWVSVSADLCYDSERDLNDIGASQISVCNITKLGYGRIDGGKGGFTEGVLFSTYSALTSSSKSGARLDQIVKWLGEDGAQGCILFDESHKAKHLFPSSGGDDAQPQPGQRGGKGRKKQKSTKMAQACQDIQQRCPNARVVYCSATGASSLDNMAYMLRLGLWGPGTAFADGFGSFATAIGKSGVGAMELVALDMKRRGMYISRQLSFKSATYDTKVIDLTPAQTSMYDAAANFWTEMHGCALRGGFTRAPAPPDPHAEGSAVTLSVACSNVCSQASRPPSTCSGSRPKESRIIHLAVSSRTFGAATSASFASCAWLSRCPRSSRSRSRLCWRTNASSSVCRRRARRG